MLMVYKKIKGITLFGERKFQIWRAFEVMFGYYRYSFLSFDDKIVPATYLENNKVKGL
jgi:hypothetical protein